MNKKQLLIILLVALGASIAYRLYQPGPATAPERPPKASSRTAKADRRPIGGIEDYVVHKNLLTAAREDTPGQVINIFAPFYSVSRETKSAVTAKPGPVSPPQAAPPVPAVVAPPPPPPKTPEQLAAEAAAQELARFRFLGFIRKPDGRSLFIGRGDELMVIREGETVKGLYNIKQIGNDYFVLSDPRTGVEKKIELSGK